jgi:hypothetical protein
VSPFLRKAEEILEVATSGGNTLSDAAIVIDRQGGFRMLDPTGWSLPGLAAEYGAAAVYKIERRGEGVRVEGWDGSDRCLLQRGGAGSKLRDLLGGAPPAQSVMRQFPALLTA